MAPSGAPFSLEQGLNMPTIIVAKPFQFAVDGNHVVTVEAGEQEVSERCALVAVEHLKVATRRGDDKPKARKTGAKND